MSKMWIGIPLVFLLLLAGCTKKEAVPGAVKVEGQSDQGEAVPDWILAQAARESGDHVRGDLDEARADLGISELPPLLRRVERLVARGFGDREIAAIISGARKLSVEEEQTHDLKVDYRGTSTTLRIWVFMDDVDTPTVGFFTSTALAQSISTEIEAYMAELGY